MKQMDIFQINVQSTGEAVILCHCGIQKGVWVIPTTQLISDYWTPFIFVFV